MEAAADQITALSHSCNVEPFCPTEAFSQFLVCWQIPLCALMVSGWGLADNPVKTSDTNFPQVTHSLFLGHFCLIEKPADASNALKQRKPESRARLSRLTASVQI